MSEMIFSDPVKLNALRYAEKEALSFEGESFSYEEFNNRINQLAHAMQEKGIHKGDKVAFMLFNCNELFEIIFACSKIGAIFVPINSRFIAREIRHVLENSHATMLIYDARFTNDVQKAAGQVSETTSFISVKDEDTFSENVYEKWIEGFPTTEPIPDEPIQEKDTICYLYTGGTTGLPKGAVPSP